MSVQEVSINEPVDPQKQRWMRRLAELTGQAKKAEVKSANPLETPTIKQALDDTWERLKIDELPEGAKGALVQLRADADKLIEEGKHGLAQGYLKTITTEAERVDALHRQSKKAGGQFSKLLQKAEKAVEDNFKDQSREDNTTLAGLLDEIDALKEEERRPRSGRRRAGTPITSY